MHDPEASGRRAERTQLRLTLAGRVFLPVAIAGLLAGWLGGGTIGMIASLAFALFALALAITGRHLRPLRVAPPPPMRISTGDAFALPLVLANDSRLFAVRNALLSAGEARGFDSRPGGHLLHLRPGERRRVPVEHRLITRGRHRSLRLVVSSFFPLGLVEARQVFELPVDLLALPRIGTLRDLGLLPPGRTETSLARQRPAAGEEEFHGVRDWREGESLRGIHWRLSARRGRRILREFRTPIQAPVHLVFSTATPPRGQRPADDRRRFETMVSLAATLAEHFLRQGRRVRANVVGERTASLPPQQGRTGLARILSVLAEVEASEDEPGEELFGLLAAARRRGEVPVLVHAGAAGSPAPCPDLLVLGAGDAIVGRLFRRVRPRRVGATRSGGAR